MYTSGLVLPIGNKGTDAFLKEQGKILEGDLKFYLLGNISTSGTVVIGIGSPPPSIPREYYIIEPGPVARGINDASLYNSVYGRYLQNGSLA